MEQSTYDLCLLYSTEPSRVVGLQTDDTLFLVDKQFADTEKKELYKAKFIAKEREELTINTPIKFNGGLIKLLQDSSISLTQER